MKSYSLAEIKKIIRPLKVIGNKDVLFSNAKTLAEADRDSIVWIKPGINDKETQADSTNSRMIIVDPSFKISKKLERQKCFIISTNPKLTYIRIIKEFFSIRYPAITHPSAVIDQNAVIDKSCYIGPNTYLGKTSIGAGTVIHGNCYIYDNVRIGKNVTINAGTVIGAEGYGYTRNEHGEFEHFPHIGGVIIEDNVDIGSNTSIDRGALGDTILKEGCKIDNLVHVAHNVVIGKHSAVIAHSMLGGSVVIDNYSWVAPSASIMNQVNIGTKVTVGMGAVVTKNVPDNETWAGIPARPLKEFVNIQKYLKKNI